MTLCIFIIFIHPYIVKSYSSIFISKQIEGQNRVAIDTSAIMFEGSHILFSILCIIALVIWCILFPLILAYYLKELKLRDRNKNDKRLKRARESFGFLFEGYKYNYRWWETVIMTRKFILVLISSFASSRGKMYQLICLLFVLAFFTGLQFTINPFHNNNLNFLENLSLITGFIIVVFGYYLMADEESTISSTRDSVNVQAWFNMLFYVFLLVLLCIFLFTCVYTCSKRFKKFFYLSVAKCFGGTINEKEVTIFTCLKYV